MRTTILLTILAAAAGCGETRTASPPAAPLARPRPVPVPEVMPWDSLNLGFEEAAGDLPKGWRVGRSAVPAATQGTVVALDRAAHGGRRSLSIAAPGGAEFTTATVSFDAKPVRGKHVEVSGWIRTEDVRGGWAGLFVRADPSGGFDNMRGRGATGTVDWRRFSVAIDVPGDAERVVLGPLLVGRGRAWFDDLSIDATDTVAPHAIAVSGRVVDGAGRPVAGAVVSLVKPVTGDIAAHAATGADGRFRLAARTGRWGLSAQHPSGVGVFTDARELRDDADLVLELGRDGGVLVRGRVTASRPLPAGAHVTAAPYSKHDTDVFYLPLSPDGSFAAVLPRGDRYHVSFSAQGWLPAEATLARVGDVANGTIDAIEAVPASDAVVDWIGTHGVPLATADPSHDLGDLEPLASLVGSARIVALGEATHGTREFFQLKHRLLQFLVARMGFTVFAIEANQPECRAINAYVLEGKGDARTALAGIYFWTWNTEEVLAMIEWMRAWNADPAHRHKVRFTGFDVQVSTVAHASVASYLGRVAPARAGALLRPLAALAQPRGYRAASSEERRAIRAGLAALAREMDRHAKAWARATGRAAFDDARHDVRILEQFADLGDAGEGMPAARDAAMAENVAWLLAHAPRHARMVLWAHNEHIAKKSGFPNMGSLLRERFGADYLTLGFLFAQGSFQAIDATGDSQGLREFTLGPPPANDLGAAFARAGRDILVLDLRDLPAGPVAEWFSAPHPMRETGALFSSDAGTITPVVLPEKYDTAIFVRTTTRARPLPRVEPRPHG